MIRQGFVSNSSSSSFIVYYPKESKNYKESNYYKGLWKSIGPTEDNLYHLTDVCTLPFKDAQTHFGWTFERFHNIKDKVNYCLLQAIDLAMDLKNFRPYEAAMGDWGPDEKASPFGILIKALYKIHKKYRDRDLRFLRLEFDWNALLDYSIYDVMQSVFIDGNSYVGDWSKSFPNNEIFFNSDKMVEFLLDADYYVQGGNDNSWNDEWDESLKLIGDPYGWLDDREEDNDLFEEDED